MFSRTSIIIVIIFSVALLLRILLALTNRDANDNHVDVVSWIVDKNEIPERKDCWSCYQPKLYYVLSAGIVKALNLIVITKRIVAMQFLNVFFAFFILLIFWKFLEEQNLALRIKIFLFALFAFNPCLIGINCQATNDTLGILAGIAFTYFLLNHLVNHDNKSFLLAVLFLIISCLTKASGLLISVILLIVLAIRFFNARSGLMRINIAKQFLIFLISFTLIVPFFGGYYNNFKKYKSFAMSAWEKDPPPKFFERTYIDRPGVKDMFHGFLTFRYYDMIKQPYINSGWEGYPEHRTSLWSQLYGRTFFMHFDQWPESWQSQKPFIVQVGRALIILGIIPLLLFIIGIICIALGAFKNIFHRKELSVDAVHLFIAACFLCASIKYNYDYRDFAAMKSIYIFPALLSFLKLIGDGWNRFVSFKIFNRTITYVLTFIICLSIIDVIYLIIQQINYHNYF
ncbi:MAG TPA: hypothetical protein VI757_11895 [Bacteroidia bacterium]|nr:hypothetical protein [Bacteroidia bacterium]